MLKEADSDRNSSAEAPTKIEESFFSKFYSINEKTSHVLVVIHDLYDYHTRYDFLYQELCSHFSGLGLALIDLKGFGHAAGVRGHTDHFDEYPEGVLYFIKKWEQENPHLKFVFMGVGLGGLVSLRFFQLYSDGLSSVQGLILINPLLELPEMNGQRHSREEGGVLGELVNQGKNIWSELISYLGPSESSLRYIKSPFFIDLKKVTDDNEEREKILSDPICQFTLSARFLSEVEKVSRDVIGHNYFIDIPCLILLSENDPFCHTKRVDLFSKGIPKTYVEKYIYRYTCHDLLHGREKKRVLADLRPWLERKIFTASNDVRK